MHDNLLSTAETCARLRVSRSTLSKLVETGRLAPPMRISTRRNLWRTADLDAFLNSLAAARLLPDRLA